MWRKDVRSLARDFEKVVDDRLKHLTSRGGLEARQVAAGALLRTRNAVEAIGLLVDFRPDFCGLVFRNLLEAMTVGILSLYDDEQFRRLAVSYRDATETMIRRNPQLGVEPPSVEASNRPEPGEEQDKSEPRYVIEQGMAAANRWLKRKGDGGSLLEKAYDLAYRAESTWGGHNLGLASPYVDWSAEPFRLRPSPTLNITDHGHHLLLATGSGALLARHLFEAFGLSTSELADIERRSLALLNRPDRPSVDREDSG